MSPKEIVDRLRQQTLARLDFLRYVAGIGFEPGLNGSGVGSKEPQFFFPPDRIPQLCVRMRQLFPEECERIVERAERICQHRFDLLGYKDLDYGARIDWHCDRVHGKRSPLKPWFRLRYLDFDEVGDSKVTWELNRHQHFVTLAKAFRLTGEEKFAAEIFAQWDHWHQKNPYPIGINWASSLEVAFRSLSWLWMFRLMPESSMPKGFRQRFYRSVGVSGRHIENNLSTYFSPNTHLLGEGAALLFIGILCPQIPPAARWQRRGWEILLQAAERQVRSDGLHFEQSIYYHVYAVDFFLHSAILASLNGITVPPEFNRTLERMMEAISILGRCGPLPSLGDDDGGRLFDGRRNRTQYLNDPLSTGAVWFGRADLKAASARLAEETLWLLGETAIADFAGLPDSPVNKASKTFPESGLYCMTESDRQMVIDAGPQGVGSAGHGHADALSVMAGFQGKPLLIDPGTFEYVGPTEAERNRFRGTAAHNTLRVDGQDQSEPKGPFSWGAVPDVRTDRWIMGDAFDLFVGSHDGYTRLAEPVVHRRTVLSVKSRFWLVRDQALGSGEHQLDLFWHLSPELMPMEKAEGAFLGEELLFRVLSAENQGWSQEISSQAWSPAYGQKELHTVLHRGLKTRLPAECATLLLPGGAVDGGFENTSIHFSYSTGESVVCYRFKAEEDEHWVFFGAGRPWTFSSWSSDADLIYWRQTRGGGDRSFIGCNFKYVAAGGRNWISSNGTISRCEILSTAGEVRVSSSGEGVNIDQEAFAGISAQEAESAV